VKLEPAQTEEQDDRDAEIVRRRTAFAEAYNTLPTYGSPAFWRAIEEPQPGKTLPLEVLVRCARLASTREDDEGRKRILEVIFRRTQSSNEFWANSVLKTTFLQAGERKVLMSDLYADLCECVMRAILDAKRSFWEENFQHCLLFERKHVYRSFMRREGRLDTLERKTSTRVPHMLLESLDHPPRYADGELCEPLIEDELAQQALLAVEQTDVPHLILYLPDRLKSVVLLIFWEGKTEKDAAQVLGVTDRTVRNRLRDALKILHKKLEPERKYVHG